jgi:hypothetical protein
LLRLRAAAVHTRNLALAPRASLFVQPPDRPARLLARATLIGTATPVSAEEAADAALRHALLHPGGAGVDAPAPDDAYLRLTVESCFYVAGLGDGAREAAVIGGEEYASAAPDPLRAGAAPLVAEFNLERAPEVARVAAAAAGVPVGDLAAAELLWVDAAGAWAWLALAAGGDATVRVPFPRPALDERDARSHLTMLSQLAWEAERNYQPVVPAAVGGGGAVAAAPQ